MSEKRNEVFNLLGWSFDIDKARELIKEHNIPVERTELCNLNAYSGFVSVDKEKALESQREDPVIAVLTKVNGQDAIVVIDGYHRMEKWKSQGKTEIEFYVIEGDLVNEIDLSYKPESKRMRKRRL